MPYIEQGRRAAVRELGPQNTGALNFTFCETIIKYMDGDVTYTKINDVLGALEGAKAEFIRRVVEPYENLKIQENGDIEWPR